MIEPMQVLMDEHGRIRRVLSCFRKELGNFERAETADYDVLEGSIVYCQEYLDRRHHPREDALLALLQRRAPAQAEACGDLERQHAGLARTTVELVRIFEAAERGVQFLRQDLVDNGTELVDAYHRHLDWEESHFFPRVTEHLLPEDWREIAPRFADAGDPLAEQPTDHRYTALFGAIAEA